MLDALGWLVDWLKTPERDSLRRAFTIWISRVMLPGRLPGADLSGIQQLQDLNEVHNMFAERMKQWPDQWKEEGLASRAGSEAGKTAAVRRPER